ncbi:MAG TPA: alkaline phosphatase family protein [Roseiflexaceae bacterium]|nr:alkaline phosphatase family protein [Roseiflexaceae bacterium]
MNTSEPYVTDTDTEATKTRETQVEEVGVTAGSQQRRRQDAVQEHLVERAREVGAPAEEHLDRGGGGHSRRILLVGLGGAAHDLALGGWRSELRTLDLLAERGAWCKLRGGLPLGNLPAWLGLFSGLDAGQLGLYGPSNRINRSYLPPQPVDSRAVRDPRLWDLLGAAGRHVGVVGAPATTPPPAVNGHLIGDRALPDGTPATFPAALAQQVGAWLGDAALPPVEIHAGDINSVVQAAYVRAEERFLLARRLLARDTYDCFVLVDDGIATVQNALWSAFDPAHPRYAPDHPFAGAIGAFYRFVDDQLFELLELVDDETIVAIASVGGASVLQGELALNEWLIEQGDLVLRSMPSQPTALELCDVDWEQTRAWASDAGAIFLNVAGREPQGVVPTDQAEQVRTRLVERLRALHSPDARPALDVYRPEALFSVRQGVAPDLFVTCALPGWRTTATVGSGGVWHGVTADGDAAIDTSNGFLLVYDPRNPAGGRTLDDASIYDVVPTLLTLCNQPIPARLRGQIIPGL